MKNKIIQYFVEGETEEKVVNVLKTDLRLILPGKVHKLNVVEKPFTNARLLALRPGTVVVLVFDTDTGHTDILNENLRILRACPSVAEVVTIPQVKNLEAELVRACSVKRVWELLGVKSVKDFKAELIRTGNLAEKLKEHNFDINLFWAKRPAAPFQDIQNMADKIKLPQT